MTSKMNHGAHGKARLSQGASGGMLRIPKTPVERIMVIMRQRKLRDEFYARQKARDA